MNDKASGKITIEDAVRLKHQLNQEITYGTGFNAKKIQEMEGLSKEQYAEVNRQLSEINKSWFFFPDYFWIIGLLISGFCIYYFDKMSVRLIALVVILYCIKCLAYRSGLRYGYVRGYESGHEGGVHKALGITDADAIDIQDRAIEMEMDERLIKKMDERKITNDKQNGEEV